MKSRVLIFVVGFVFGFSVSTAWLSHKIYDLADRQIEYSKSYNEKVHQLLEKARDRAGETEDANAEEAGSKE